MRIKKLALALVACVALSVAVASAAQANWTVGTETPGSSNVSVSGGPWTLESELLSTKIKINATAVECSGTCTISGANESAGTLKYTGVTVEPSTCSVTGGSITTKALKDLIVMDGTEVTFDKFFPASGETFAEFELTGGSCPLAGNVIVVKGVTYGRASNTGVAAVEQSLKFNATEEATGGSTLHIGKSTPATLIGTAINKLTGAHAGQSFSAHE